MRDQGLTAGEAARGGELGELAGRAEETGASRPAGPPDPREEPAAVVPPSLLGRLYNAAGGPLPPEHREWVRRDLTGPGWRRRLVLRPVLLALPFSVVFMVVPGSLQLRIPIAVGILVWTAGMSLAMSSSFRNRRLRINGLPPVEDSGSAEDAWDEARRAEEARAEEARAGQPEPDRAAAAGARDPQVT